MVTKAGVGERIMMGLYVASVWLHVIAATVWLGGSVFLIVGVLPYFRGQERGLLLDYMSFSAPRLRVLGWVSFFILFVTGVVNLAVRGYHWADLASGHLWEGPFGLVLAQKLGLVAVILLLSAVHDFHFGPRTLALRRAEPESAAALRARAITIRIGQANLGLALLVVLLAVMLVRGQTL